MINRILSALALAVIGSSTSSVAHAQHGLGASGQPLVLEDKLTSGFDLPAVDRLDRIAENKRVEVLALAKTGVAALSAKDYALAERSFAEVLLFDPSNADVNFLMGLSQIGLMDWSAARGFLENATTEDAKRAEPKTRLGLTYVKLGDVASARKQRADLAALDGACKGSCADAKWIADGLHLLDEALAEPAPSEAFPPAPATTAISVAAAFKPADYGAATFHSQDDVYRLLTEEGRCPPGYKPAKAEPCALIAYTPENMGPGIYKQYYRPVFGVVSKNVIWTMVDSRIAAVSVKTLWAPVEVENTVTTGVKDSYRALAVVGNRENVENCNQAKACLPHTELFLHYRDMKALPQSFIEDFWGKKKMSAPDEHRFSTDP